MVDVLPELSKFIKDNNKVGTCIKFTFGKYTDAFGFDAKLFNKSNYEKIKTSFDSYKKWEEVQEEVISGGDEHPMKVVDSIVIKNKGPYDILVTAETIEKVDIDVPILNEINLYTYEWKRHDFVLKNYIYSIGDSIQKLEIYTKDCKVCSDYLAHSSILKIKDIMNMFKNDGQGDTFMEILQNNNQLKNNLT